MQVRKRQNEIKIMMRSISRCCDRSLFCWIIRIDDLNFINWKPLVIRIFFFIEWDVIKIWLIWVKFGFFLQGLVRKWRQAYIFKRLLWLFKRRKVNLLFWRPCTYCRVLDLILLLLMMVWSRISNCVHDYIVRGRG